MIREATIDDAGAIATIHVRGWQAAYAGILPVAFLESLSIETRTTYWQRNLRQPRPGTLVGLTDETVVGWIDHGPSRDDDRIGESEVYAVYVHPEHWGRGTGTKLMQRTERDVFTQGITRISLWVLEQNLAARRFYERHDYALDGSRKDLEIGGMAFVELRYSRERSAVVHCSG